MRTSGNEDVNPMALLPLQRQGQSETSAGIQDNYQYLTTATVSQQSPLLRQ